MRDALPTKVEELHAYVDRQLTHEGLQRVEA